MRINLSGPRSLDYVRLFEITGSLIQSDNFILSDMRYGAANGKLYGCEARKPATEELVKYNVYVFRQKDQLNIDVQEDVPDGDGDSEVLL